MSDTTPNEPAPTGTGPGPDAPLTFGWEEWVAKHPLKKANITEEKITKKKYYPCS